MSYLVAEGSFDTMYDVSMYRGQVHPEQQQHPRDRDSQAQSLSVRVASVMSVPT